MIYDYMINNNKNEAEKWKLDHKYTKWVDQDLDMDTNMLNIKYISVK